MNRKEREETLKSLESLLGKISNNREDIYAHEIAALKDVVDNFETSVMTAYFDLENWLYKQTEKPLEMKSAMVWGGLKIAKDTKCIDWETMQKLYGEFMSKQMNVR